MLIPYINFNIICKDKFLIQSKWLNTLIFLKWKIATDQFDLTFRNR